MNIIVDKGLSNSELVTSFTQFIDSDVECYASELRSRRNDIEGFFPLVEIMEYYHKGLSHSSKKSIIVQIMESSLTNVVISKAISADVISTESPSFNDSRNILAVITTLACKYFNINTIEDLSVDIWSDLVDQIKNSDSSFDERISFRYQNGMRLLAKTLDRNFGNLGFRSALSVKRSRYSLNSDSGTLENPRYNQWLELYNTWINDLLIKNTKEHWSSFNHLYEFLICSANAEDPIKFLSVSRASSFYVHIKNSDLKHKRRIVTCVYQFSSWIMSEYLTETDGEDSTTIGFPIVSHAEYIQMINSNDGSCKGSLSETVKQPMPTKWIMLCKSILTDNDYEWPKSLTNEYFIYKNMETGKHEEVWCPVATYIFQIMLELPLRKIQVKSLESGEGDREKYSINEKVWIKNRSKHASYWANTGSAVTERGFVRKMYSLGGESTGLYINTNKTQDRNQAFSESSGYDIPWDNEQVIRIAYKMLEWQESYNPVDKPIKYADIPKNVWSARATKAVLEMMPDRFYLFRSPLNSGTSEAPPAEWLLYRFWLALMDELERRLKEQGLVENIITKRTESNKPEAARFTPHGLRVAGLTAFIEAGVPIEILSKIVAGHATILMTLYYIKFNPAHISEVLSNAKKEIEGNEQNNFTEWLKSASWNDASRYSIFNDVESYKDWSESKSGNLWESNQIGICPNAGTRCSEGGEVLRKNVRKNTNIHAPVSGGSGNCIRCRFFVTGAPWMIPLWLHGNKLLADSQRLSVNLEECRKKLDELTNKRYEIIKSSGAEGIPASLKSEIKTSEAILDAKTVELDNKLGDAHATYRTLEKIKAIADSDSNENMPVLSAQDVGDIEFSETSEFRVLDTLVQASRIYPHVQDKNFERDRDHFIDQFMFNAGETPITLSKLSDEEKRIASDCAARYLSMKLSDQELNQLQSGSITLNDLGVTGELQNSIEESSGACIPLLDITE